MKRVNLSIDSKQQEQIDLEARRTGRPKSEIARTFLDAGMQTRAGYAPDVSYYHRQAGDRQLDWGVIASGELSGFEREVAAEGKREFKNAGLPTFGNIQLPMAALQQRDLTVGVSDQGGYTIATDLLSGSFIELLYNRMMVKEMGATVLSGLSGDIAIPSQATGATAVWEGENDEAAESSPTFGQVALSPNRIGTYIEMSKQLGVQSSLPVDHLVKTMLSDAIAVAIDYAALHGTGTNNQPLGLAGTSGIGSVSGGTNGAAPTLEHLIELETDVASANGILTDQSTGYLTNAKVRGKLKQVFANATYGEQPLWHNDMLNGYKAGATNQVRDDMTKGSSSGVCSGIFFGDWSQMLVAQWGGLDLLVDPYTLAVTNRTVISANAYFDIGIRNPASFSVFLDALT